MSETGGVGTGADEGVEESTGGATFPPLFPLLPLSVVGESEDGVLVPKTWPGSDGGVEVPLPGSEGVGLLLGGVIGAGLVGWLETESVTVADFDSVATGWAKAIQSKEMSWLCAALISIVKPVGVLVATP